MLVKACMPVPVQYLHCAIQKNALYKLHVIIFRDPMLSVGQFSVSSTYLQQKKKHQLADVTDN